MRSAFDSEKQDHSDLKTFLKLFYTGGKEFFATMTLVIFHASKGFTNNEDVKVELQLGDHSFSVKALIYSPCAEFFDPDSPYFLSVGSVLTTKWHIKKNYRGEPELSLSFAGRELCNEYSERTSFDSRVSVLSRDAFEGYDSLLSESFISPIDARASYDDSLKSFSDRSLAELLKDAISLPGYFLIPAAIGNHHVHPTHYYLHNRQIEHTYLALLEALPLEIVNRIDDKSMAFIRELGVCAAALHDLGKLVEYECNFFFKADESLLGNFIPHIPRGLDWIVSWNTSSKFPVDPYRLIFLMDMIANHHGHIEKPRCPATGEAYRVQYLYHKLRPIPIDDRWRNNLSLYDSFTQKVVTDLFNRLSLLKVTHWRYELIAKSFALFIGSKTSLGPNISQTFWDVVTPKIFSASIIAAFACQLPTYLKLNSRDEYFDLNSESKPYRFTEGLVKYLAFQQFIRDMGYLDSMSYEERCTIEIASNIVLSIDEYDGVDVAELMNSADLSRRDSFVHYCRFYFQDADYDSFVMQRDYEAAQGSVSDRLFPERGDFSVGGNRFMSRDISKDDHLFKSSLPQEHIFQSPEIHARYSSERLGNLDFDVSRLFGSDFSSLS